MKLFIEKLEELIEVDPGTLSLETPLEHLDEWDSLARVSFIALAECDYAKDVTGEELSSCEKVEDLFQLVNA